MRKKTLLLLSLGLIVALCGCNKSNESTPDVYNNTEIQSTAGIVENDIEVVYAAEETPTPEATPTPVAEDAEVSGDGAATDEAVEEEPKVLYAKTYKQVYPELYSFYPENPAYKYSQWVFTIDSSSGFVGTITLPDGTVIVGGGSPGDKGDTNIDISAGDYTGGSKPTGSTGGTGGTSTPGQTGPVIDVVVGDPTTNPKGEDLNIIGGGNDEEILVTTKTIKDAKIIDKKTSPFTVGFKTKEREYYFESNTVLGIMETLEEGDYYDGVSGSVELNKDIEVRTAGGVYQMYDLHTLSGDVYHYAAVYTPTYSANSVYMLTSTDIEQNEDLMTILQLLVVE